MTEFTPSTRVRSVVLEESSGDSRGHSRGLSPCDVILGDITNLLHFFREGVGRYVYYLTFTSLPATFSSTTWKMFMFSRMILTLPAAFDCLRFQLSSLDSTTSLRAIF